MAENPFLKSPLTDADFTDAPPQPRRQADVAVVKGVAPTRQDLIKRAQELDIDPALALSFFSQESSGNWNSRDSNKGARGGMQVMPGTYRSMMGTDAGQTDPWNNMEAGLRYISYGQKRLGTRDPELLAAGYHAGYDRKDLKAGIIPNTSDGAISTRDYAKSVAARLGKGRSAAPSVDDQFSDTPDGAASPATSDFVDSLDEAKSAQPALAGQPQEDLMARAERLQAETDARPYLDRLTEETKSGFGDMTRSLTTARWALGAGDAKDLAEELAQSFQEQAKKPKTTAQQEIDAAYKGVTDAKGVLDTTIAGAKALGTSLINPKETSIEIARNAANSLPTLAGGAAGAGTGAAVGGTIGALPGAVAGAVIGGRSGMAAGTTATELGAEIQDMVQKRLADAKQPPTAQNILAVLSDKDFQSAALKQGAAKGLTVAAVDQLFMGLGGKIATAPARKIATKEFADAGIDMSTRAARKEALDTAAGRAAIAAAKPTVAARVGAGTAAVGVDAAGESIGEGLSQKVARGEVDYGDALREGVASLGQSVAQTAAGATIETAKLAAAQAKDAIQATPKAPSTASGPLARATENAAATPERVTVTAPDGQVSGTVTGQTADAVQIVGDDGQVYNFKTGPDGVEITPEAPNTPLSNALEVAADDDAQAPAEPAPVAPADQAGPADVQASSAAAAAQPGEAVAPAQPEPSPALSEPPKAPVLADMDEPALRERLKYIAGQAKTNGGWNSMLTKARREVEKEINARAPKVEAPKVTPPAITTWDNMERGQKVTLYRGENEKNDKDGQWWTTDRAKAERYGAVQEVTLTAEVIQQNSARGHHGADEFVFLSKKPKYLATAPAAEPVVQATPTQKAAAAPVVQTAPAQQQAATLPKDLAGAKERYNYGNKGFELKFSNDVDRAAFMTAQTPNSKRDADYLAFAMRATGMSEDEVRAHGRAVKDSIKGMAKDASPGTLKVPEVSRGQTRIEPTPAPVSSGQTQSVGLPVMTGKNAFSNGQFGASVGNISEGNRRQLMVDPNGGFYWGDWNQAAERDTGAVVVGNDKDGTPAFFTTSKEAKEAAQSTPQDKTAPSNASAPAKSEPAQPAASVAKVTAKPVDQLTNEDWNGVIGGIQGPARADGPNDEISIDDVKLLKKMVVKAIKDGVAAGKSREQIVAKIEGLTKGGISNAAMTRINELLDNQPAPITFKTTPAPAKPTASQAALDRIAKGTAYFGTTEKAQAFIDKNGLSDTHAVEQTGKVRFEVKAKEQANVTDERPSGQPASPEKVVSREEAPAAPAPVQPDAPAQAEEVNRDSDAFKMGLSHATRGYRMDPPGNVIRSKKDKAAYEAGWMEGKRQEDQASASDTRSDVDHSGYVIQPIRVGGKEAWQIKGRTTADGIKNSGTFASLDLAKKEVDRVAANEERAKAEEAKEPLTPMAQGAEAAKTGAGRTPPAGMTAKQRFEWTQGYDSQAGTTPASQQPKTDTSQFAGNKIFTEDAVAKARARMKSKLGNLNAGIDPEMIMDGMTLAGAYIEAGTRSFAAYAKAMTDDFGPKIKPYLLSFYEAARNYPGLNTEGLTPVADAKAEFDALNAEDSKATDQLAELESLRTTLEAKLEDQGMVTDARTRQKLAEVTDAIAEIKHPAIYKALSENGGLTLKLAQELRMNEGSEAPAATIGRVLRGLVEPYRTDMTKAVLRAIGVEDTITPTSTEAEGNDNGPQKLDQSGSRELEGKQPDALQGAEPQRQAGPGPEGRSGADAPGNERAGSAGNEQPGRLGNDAGEVPSLASRRNAGRGGKQGSGAVQRSERPAKPNPASAERGNQPELIPETGTRAQDRADGFVITDEDAIGEGGQKTKFKQNVAAIRLLKELTAENRQATRAEQAVLAKYVGWGGIPQAFYRDNNEVTKGWEKEAAELKELMTADELAAAASSTRNAHYTSTEIVQAVWDAVKHFGFQGGRVLEPSLGVGNFYGLMPTALRSASQLTGVELDHITGGIAKQLYPQANIAAPVGFQDFSAPDNYFELAIGNPPFGREGIYDAIRRKISGFSIHNYFFAKSIDTVKPNGVLAMVVTNRLLDSMGDKARSYIADRAEFLGAIRLPNDAFAKNAGTQVTTDIIFLRKLKDGEQPTGQRWMDVRQYKDKDGNTVPLNEYFVKNPDMMLGDFGQYGSMYSAEDAALVARPGQDTPALLQAAIAKLPKGFMDAPTAEPVRETIEPLHDISRVKIGSVFEQGGQIFERREDMLGKQQAAPVVFASDKAKDRVTGMIKVRDALIEVRGLQLQEGVSDKALETARAALNKEYDAFVKANGPINADANKRLMRDDPTWPQLAALEDKFDKGVSAAVAKTTGEKARAPSAEKSAIFSKRTQAPYKAPEKATSAKDAMVSSLAERGRVDLDYMASLYGKTPEVIAQELEGLIFKNPTGGWESRDQYLSGNVKKKLAQAIDAAKADPSLKANVDALKAVQPADIEAVDIDVKTGAHWVPADVMQGFITHISEGQNAKALYNPVSASWTLNVERVPQSAMTQWSTDRANILAVLEAAANQKQITIYDKFSDGTRTLNEAATTAANEKVERVKAEWKNWIWADDARRERLARIYNDTFNTDQQREFDGSHLKFPGKVGDDIIQLRPHQANAVWRMVQSGTTLLDHVVGAGKTFTMIAGIMEMRRMGLAKKPMLVVPNHLVGQWAEDFMKLYPGANILAATKKDFEKDSRKRLFARIATGDWDAVIVAHSSFGKVEVEPEFQAEFIKQQISDMDTSIKAMREAEGKGSRNVKQIEKQKAALEEKLKKLFDTGSKDDNLHFGELGVDAVLLDEAHEFKNLGFSTSMQRVAGLGNPSGSNKAADMFMKVQATLQRTGGKNVVFATGTPISNTMAEMYTMQRFLDYGTLKDQGIAHFDAWAKTFGEVVTDWELSPSGQYKMNSRFAKFVNMPELMQRYGSFADVINRDDINRQLAEQGKKLPVPKVAGGKPENTVVERSRDQAQYIGIPTVDENGVETYPQGSLVWRAENLPKKAEKGSDNMLKIMSDARKAALDMRLIDPSYPDNPGSKVNVAANNIKTIYDQWTKDKGTQLVFCDLSTPKGAVAKEAAALRELVKLAEDGDEAAQSKLDAMSPDELLALDSQFSVYDDLKAKLIAKGIPENEIAFIHDAGTDLQKAELFAKVRTSRVRVLIGSTSKMGAGMNVQDRLVALHHLDAPWRPSDLEQREGRIIRQGNRLYEANPEGFEVAIKRYATKQTLDSRMWQTIEAKARFIEQVRKGTGEREVEDVAGEAANSAEMKAASSGNPLILEEMSLRQAIRKLENQQAEHNREQFRIKDRARWITDQAKHNDTTTTEIDSDVPRVPSSFAVTVGNQTFDKHGEAGEAILAAVMKMLNDGKDSRDIGTYGGFDLSLEKVATMGTAYDMLLIIKGEGEYQIDAKPGSSPQGLALRLQNTVKDLASRAKELRAQAERNRADVTKLEAQIKPWGRGDELEQAKARHAAIIEQLKPKKKPEAAKPEGDVRMSRSGLEPIFEALDGRGLTRKRALDSLANLPDGEKIAYIENNFWDILGELEDKGMVKIAC